MLRPQRHSITKLRFVAVVFSLLLAPQLFAQSTDRPNIVVIIADDLGYGETGMMGNREIPTPHIDSLASDGVRCTSGYVTASVCSPSRAGLMTGRYQSRYGYDINPTGERNLLPQAGLPESETTFVRKLADAGYATGLNGKWHLGTDEAKRPLQRGFTALFRFSSRRSLLRPRTSLRTSGDDDP